MLWPAALLVDAACVVAFAALGTRSHDEGAGVGGVLEVAAPFLIALALGWLGSRAWRRPLAVRTGTTLWVVTVAAGMALRGLAFDRGTALAFIAVAVVALGVLLVGWRGVVAARRMGAISRSGRTG